MTTTRENELMPCPFCGSPAVDLYKVHIQCTGCTASLSYGLDFDGEPLWVSTRKQAFTAWNTRAK